MTLYKHTVSPPPRLTGIGKCSGAITVELFPYLRTPNPGGEYKVWMTPVGDYACSLTDQKQCNVGFFGFIPSKSKTDNFKVIDYNGNGIPDSEDACPDGNLPSLSPPCVANSTVSITATSTPAYEPFLDQSGQLLSPAVPGEFTITLSAPAPSGGLVVDYSIGATDSLGQNVLNNGTAFDVLSGTVNFVTGQTTATILVVPLEVTSSWLDVTLTLTGTSNPAYTADSSSSTATVEINLPAM